MIRIVACVPWSHPGSRYFRLAFKIRGWYFEAQFSVLQPEKIAHQYLTKKKD